jgi:glutamate-1-semialdehyde 2,1-aminomutase
MLLGLVAAAVRRVGLLVLTLAATAPPSLMFIPLSHSMPRYSFNDREFFRADGCAEAVARKRETAFDALNQKWAIKWKKSLETSAFLAQSFSDLRFMSSNRVFLPFQKKVEGWCDPCTVIERTEGPYLIDVDGHRLLDVSGSYGVNVCGYDRYKRFMIEGSKMVENVGCVLGPVHPILKENIDMLKRISMQDEISFHMSGTEAVMAGLRLARFNTQRPLVVLFAGSYHGWWDGVQSLAGNERTADDILTLKDMSPTSLQVIRWRYREIAAVVVNPLQAFHPNSPPPSDLALATNNRHTSESTTAYKTWLAQLKETCNELGIVFFLDEVFTGARLARGGAQEYFGIQADMVAYGKTFGGGAAIGLLAGPRRLMNRIDPEKPLRVAYVVGTFSAAPLTLACQNRFLHWLHSDEAKFEYDRLRREVAAWRDETTDLLNKVFDSDPPIAVQSYSSVWTIMYRRPSRYNFLLQYYLRDEGLNLSWVGTGRVCFSLDFTQKELVEVRDVLIRACRRMEEDGWWVGPRGSLGGNGREIQASLAKEVLKAMISRLFK